MPHPHQHHHRHSHSPPPPPFPPPPPPPHLAAHQWARLTRPSNISHSSGDAGLESASFKSSVLPEEGTLAAVAESIRHCAAGMSRWGMPELTFGLYKIAVRHAQDGAADTISGYPVFDKQELEEMRHWLDWAMASYEKDRESLLSLLQIKETQLKKHICTSAALKPAYFIAIDDAKCRVVMSIRGTSAATDVLTDLKPHSEKIGCSYAHSGMLAAARWILQNESRTLQDLLYKNPGYGLMLTGHSLGAGTASILCMLLHNSFNLNDENLSSIPTSMVTCWGFGCPPCVDRNLAERAIFISNVVLQDDIVARVSPAAFEDLRSEILQTDWVQILEDGSKAKKMLELVQSTHSFLKTVEPILGYENGFFYEQAKKYSYAAIISATQGITSSLNRGQLGMYASQSHGATRWFSIGATALGSYLTSAGNRNPSVPSIPCSNIYSSVMDSAIMENANRRVPSMERLFVPGVLHHIIRKPIQGEQQRDDLGNGCSTASEAQSTDCSKGQKSQSRSETSNSQRAARHIVVRGDDPASRFLRIVFSRSMFSDHSLFSYKDGILDAIHWAISGSPVI